MNRRKEIICPYCNTEMFDDIYEFTDSGDMDGFFHLECEECQEKFEVVFQFEPFISEHKL